MTSSFYYSIYYIALLLLKPTHTLFEADSNPYHQIIDVKNERRALGALHRALPDNSRTGVKLLLVKQAQNARDK